LITSSSQHRRHEEVVTTTTTESLRSDNAQTVDDAIEATGNNSSTLHISFYTNNCGCFKANVNKCCCECFFYSIRSIATNDMMDTICNVCFNELAGDPSKNIPPIAKVIFPKVQNIFQV
jgi:hypothetical protein